LNISLVTGARPWCLLWYTRPSARREIHKAARALRHTRSPRVALSFELQYSTR